MKILSKVDFLSPAFYFYVISGYDGGASSWNAYPQYASAEGLHVVPPVRHYY